jgi:co-chaperonin GroES (HSP10)
MTLPVTNEIQRIKPLGDTILVTDMNFKERFTSGGIVLLNDDGKTAGIRPRWGQVYSIGPDQKDVTSGDWVCVSHGRWTRGIEISDNEGKKTIRRIDPKDILLVSAVQPPDDTMSDAIQSQEKTR